jgi:hypothetical protein
LIRCGATLATRTVARRLSECRAERERAREMDAAERRRVLELEAIGRGLGSVQLGITGAAEILQASLPDWREKQSATLRDLFAQFQKAPSADLFSGLVVGLYAILLGRTLADNLGNKNA